MSGVLRRIRDRLRDAVGLDEPAERLAAAWAVGVGLGLCPFLGLHTLLALLIALAFRLNKVDVLLGTLVLNPWTMPIYIPAAVFVGKTVTGLEPSFHKGAETLLEPSHWRVGAGAFRNLLITWGVGAAICAVPGALLTYAVLVRLVNARRRRQRTTGA